ncbi:hippocalcin-like protein 1 isoform X2 [Rhopilema esculentum]|eukprot:gene16312-7700_t
MGKAQSKIPPSELQDLAKHTYFDEHELKKWYTAFSRDCPTGRLNKEQFIELYKNFYETVDATKFAEHVFRTFDVNHDNTIDFREFICSLSVTTRGTSDEKLKWAFGIYDIDGNGYITKTEIVSIVQSIQKMVGALDDSNTSEEKLLKVFTMFDTNRDGKLSMEEFLEGAKKDKIFMKMLQSYV